MFRLILFFSFPKGGTVAIARVAVTARQRDSLSSQQAARRPAERHIMPSGSPASVHAQVQVHTVQM